MPSNDRKLRIFLCHASQDKPIVQELYRRLFKEDWIEPWIDDEKLLPGQDWDLEIEKAVEAADAVIVCLSNKSVSKEGYVQREIRLALSLALEKPEENIYIIPLRFDDCPIPRSLRSIQYIDYYPVEQAVKAYNRILESLRLRSNNRKKELPSSRNSSLHKSKKTASLRSESKVQEVQLTLGGYRVYTVAGIQFVKIPASPFLMGSSTISNAKPLHELKIDYDYWISRFPISQHQYRFKRKKANEHEFPIIVEEYNANDYAIKLNQKYSSKIPDGYRFMIVSEAEWEKAARGSDARNYPWGETLDTDRCAIDGRLHQCGSYSPKGDSPFGASDMVKEGIWEWTRTNWGHGIFDISYKYPYQPQDGREYRPQHGSSNMVMRGGCVFDPRNKANIKYPAVAARMDGRTHSSSSKSGTTPADQGLIRIVISKGWV